MLWWITLCGLCFLCGRLTLWDRLPDAIPRWHRRIWRLLWGRKSRARGGRPRIDAELIARIRNLSVANPLWGAPRIHGELSRLGYSVARSTVSRYMLPRYGRPTQGWTAFLRNHVDGIAAVDMLCVPTLCFGRLYALIVLGHGRRRILHVGVTDHPTAMWLASEISATFAEARPVWLIRDNDRAYGLAFRRKLRSMGIRDRPTQLFDPTV